MTRTHAGPTTMDHEVALIMCNQALARKGRLLFDPFVGTGSILLAAALYGAYTVGTDIDARVLRMGKVDAAGAPVNNWTNFDDAALPRPLALLQADLARPPWRAGLRGWADAIVCDPPYGVRAGGRKSGGRKQDSAPDVPVKPVPDHLRATHIPSTAFYPMAECVADLLDTAAATLVMHGRLVYFYPTSLMEDRPEALPTHPCLQTIANSQQLLSTRLGRRLVTMRKVREWYPGAKAEAKAVADEVAASTAAAAEAAARAAAAAAKGVHPHSGGAWSASINAQPGAARAVIPTHRNKRT
jgi:tRNA (guanine10-N2)-methyltransferase